MSYSKRNWLSGTTPLSKENLEAMDEALYQNDTNINALQEATTAANLRATTGVYPMIEYYGEPTESTVGKFGQGYWDSVRLRAYLCTQAIASKYTWHELVLSTLTIAGIDLSDDITVEQLQTALEAYPFKVFTATPTTSDVGKVGQFGGLISYDNINARWTVKLYLCCSAGKTEGTYQWVLINSNEDGVGIESSEINDSGELVFTYTDGNVVNVGKVVGNDGKDGADGVSPELTITPTSSGYIIGITDADGTTKAYTLSHGVDGEDGQDGANGVDGKDGEDGYTPVKGIDYYTDAEKAELVSEITETLTADGIPEYWQTALDEGAETINTALCEAGYNKSAFLFYTDAHYNYGSQMSPKLLKYLYKHTGLNKTFFGGDIVNDEATDYDTMAYLWDWRKQLKDLPNHHSVVGNHDDGNSTDKLFSEQYVYGYLLGAEETPDVVRGNEGIYYYIDNPAEKTRYLCLDTAYKGVDDTQLAFVKEALLSTPDGWHIVVIAHAWYQLDYDQYDLRPVPLSGLDTNATKVISQLDLYNSRSGDYADCSGWVEFCIGGHIHYDYDGTTDTGIPIILVETDSQHIRGSYSYTAGTTTEASVNAIVANYDEHKINIIRIGRGESREVEITNYEVSYTNLLDTIGYEVDQEYSTSSGTQRDSSSGYDLTGFIELTSGDTYYLKNFIMPDGVTDRQNMIYIFESDKSWRGSLCLSTSTASDWNVVFGDDGNLSQFTVPSGYTGLYIRINCTQIDNTSVLTKNEPLE